MDKKPLGNTCIQIPEIGYGTWKYEGAPSIIQCALELGAYLIDTAESYNTEHHVGNAIRGNRESYFVATKVSPTNFHYKDVLLAADRSLKELGVEEIDLYQLHWPNHDIPIEETMSAMDKLVKEGKVRHIGVCNFSVELLREAELALGHARIVSNQIKYSLFDHEFADEIVPYCRDNGITILAYSSLEQGAFQDRITERAELGSTLDAISNEIGKTRAQIILNWVLREPNVVTIPMTNRIERIHENCGAAGWRLSDSQHKAITKAAGPSSTRRWWTN